MINSIKKADPKSKIIFITTPAGETMLRNDNSIDHIIVYDKKGIDRSIAGIYKTGKKIKEILHGEKSVYISLHRFIRASLLGRIIGSEIRAGFKNSVLSFLYTERVDYELGIHETERNFKLLFSVLGEKLKGRSPLPPVLIPSDTDIKKVKKIINGFCRSKKIISIAPGSVWETKRWPAEYFRELIAGLGNNNVKIVLIGGREDRDLCRSLETHNTLNLAGELSLLESAAAVGMSGLLVTNDSAPLHIASAMNVPTVAIFGATVQDFGFGPLAKRSVVLENNALGCRPCGRHGSRECAKKHFNCMKSIAPGRVLDAVMKIIK
ncbi:MAG: glycosyltransferase family 9 protein [Spirochaetota bacterium]